MKRIYLLFIGSFVLLHFTFSQNIITVSEDISSNTTWSNNNIYLLKGNSCLHVKNNATLTIEPGTIIKGNPSALVITRGSKLIAQGTEKQPIVFTSSKPAGERAIGDWGGIAILGAARVNCPSGECLLEGGCDPSLAVYGGTNDNDNSGILTYVRIEYAGIAFQPNNELNSLTLAGVGKGTTIHHVQSSFGGDDAYEWFGGNVDSKYLIAYKTVDDMFDTDFGYTGRNQFSLGISDPQIADVSGSNGFEADNDAQGTLNTPISNGVFTNVTIFGPKSDPSVSINSNFKRGVHLRRSTRQDHYNSIITGFPTGLRVEGTNTENAYLNLNELNIKGNLLAGVTKVLDSTSVNSSAVLAKLLTDGNNVYPNVADMLFTNSNIANPDLRPKNGSPLLSFANAQDVYNDVFFTKVNYVGAFDAENNWTNCWAEWNPQQADYSVSPLTYSTFVADFTISNQNSAFTFTPKVNDPTLKYFWDFGDGNTSSSTIATNNFKANGSYDVQLTITNTRGCSETKTVKLLVSKSQDIEYFTNVNLAPNPTSDQSFLSIYSNKTIETNVSIRDLSGKLLEQKVFPISMGTNTIVISTEKLISGIYLVQISNSSGLNTLKLQVVK